MSLIVRKLSVPLGECHIVEDASLTVEPGNLTGLIGANGAGKSTLMRAIAGLLPDAKGEVRLDDITTASLTPRQLAHRLAYLPQGQQVDWSLTVRDVVGLGRFPFQGRFGRPSAEDRAIVEDTIGRLGLSAIAERAATSLSGGERALVLLGRALAARTPYLFADEPTAALDPARQLEVIDLLSAEAKSGKGILVVLHDLNLASRYLDQVIVMHRGRIIADGPPAEVLCEDTLQTAYGITPLTGESDGQRWLIPWRRT
ncbi:ABC transporter ATP-binding protein [Parvularcula marina]|uniref:ABC transporter ATP-binding protein n=1 Tax=Parvularcula marina TaxID=2292771 RepID=A0A371RJY5_9PROT|nr:ABC transporter ATP-binding protein [Parvularcula marina]RFB05760.1 ABC transporter ATP-binding protein [Parvularcula marina]